MTHQDTVVNLDALIPQPRTIRLGEQDIEIKPPTTADVFTLGFLGQKIQNGADLIPTEVEELVEKLTAQVKKCVPELATKELNTSQLLKLVEIISEMGMPTEAEELRKKGITTKTPKVNP